MPHYKVLYGANWNYNSGNTTYSWALGAKVFETIWDGGGTDVIDASNQALGVKIDLNSGAWSEIGVAFSNGQSTLRNYSTIAYNAVIENATGSAYDDTLVGNGVANVLIGGTGNDNVQGGEGNDTLTGGIGDDTLNGQDGSDWAYYTNASGSVTVNLALGTATGADGNDTLIGIEDAYGSNSADTLTGNAGQKNTLYGGNGNDAQMAVPIMTT